MICWISSQVAGRGGWRVKIAAVVVLAPMSAQLTGSRADAADIATPEQVEGMTHICSSCHGVGGRSISPTFPRLAGQQKDYLISQLKSFRDKTRADPHAQTYMWGMAAHLSDPMIEGIASYYSSQPPVAGTPSTSPAVKAGAKIFAEGLPAEQIAPCQSCHGPTGAGNGPFPRLAGQHQDYVVRQLEAFASEARANPIMHEMSKKLSGEQIGDIAAFLATQ